MRRLIFLLSAILAFTTLSIGQDQSANPPAPNVGQNTLSGNDPSGQVAMKGTSEIQHEIAMSLEDHAVSGLDVKVTDSEIDLAGTVPNKAEKSLAHDIAIAYADGRKVRDHVKD